MPLEKKGYPFSEYAVKTGLTVKEEELVQDVLDACDRKLALSAFCKKHDLDHQAWQSFLSELDVSSLYQPLPPKDREAVAKKLESLLHGAQRASAIAQAVVRGLYGYALIEPLFDDPELEDIMVNGIEENVWVFHREAGMCKTNLRFTQKQLNLLLSQLSAKDWQEDLRLVDGSRANVLRPPASPYPVVTVRLFRRNPFSLVDLIKNKTLSPEAAAFLWVAFEGFGVYPLNVLVVGGTAAGKTATLNALASFIPPSDRVVSIEDTPELNLAGRQNWIPLVSSKTASSQDLLKNALRMRPDRLIVGEVRGAEAEALFTAMNVGHRGSCGTVHANNDRDAILRLENTPMNVPSSLLPLADLIVVQHRVYDRRAGLIRRVMQVSEVSRTEAVIGLNEIFSWDSQRDVLERTETPSASIEKLARAVMKTPAFVLKAVKERERVLSYLLEKNISKHKEVCEFLAEYYNQSRQE